jgi:hypothetical protein
MQNSVTVFTDKVMRMMRSMVYLAMRVGYRRGATVFDIETFLNQWAPAESKVYHQGIIERVLQDLRSDGKVVQAGARWYVAPVTA